MKILLIEDEPKLNTFLQEGLRQNGYAVDAALHGSEGLELASVGRYDLVVLDVMLPGQNGFEILNNMRQFQIHTPVIIISALNDTENVIRGLDAGAVDYIKKPFDFAEFLARIRAVTRKGDPKSYTTYQVGQLTMNLLSRKVLLQAEEINLTNREFALLELLLQNCNRVLSKTEIAERVWEVSFDMGSNVIEVHLSQLRKKLKDEIIHTKIGVGYYIEGALIKK
jgi:two-component system copper resistance phosphate regulon response regulator CusR